MTKLVMDRRASDNVYLHKDFHGALSNGIEYIDLRFGADAVREYLWQFTTTFYAPLIQSVKERGLVALKEHYEKIYQSEGGRCEITLSADEMTMKVDACPAVTHIRQQGYTVARLYSETTRTVNEALCAGTPYASEMLEYDEATGRSTVRFFRRNA